MNCLTKAHELYEHSAIEIPDGDFDALVVNLDMGHQDWLNVHFDKHNSP